ncbi:MAG: hypothetical protein ACK58T_42635 [Phycisphaerae bacterium]|jgi:hypothetical protein
MAEDTSSDLIAQEASTAKRRAIDFFKGKLFEKYEEIPESIKSLNESELVKNFNQTTNDYLIRKRVTELLKRVPELGSDHKFDTPEIYTGICTHQAFYDRMIQSPYRLCYYFLELHSYDTLIEDTFYQFTMKVRNEILQMPVTEKSAPVILKAWESFANRHLGATIQKIEQKSMNVNVSASARDVNGSMDPELMLQKYNEAKAKLVSGPKDVTEPDEPT